MSVYSRPKCLFCDAKQTLRTTVDGHYFATSHGTFTGTGFRFFCEGPVFLVEALLPRVMLAGTSHSIGNAGITHRSQDSTQVCLNRLLGGTLTCP